MDTSSRHYIEKEVKFKVVDIHPLLHLLRSHAQFSRSEYIRDVIYGASTDKRKVRLRVSDHFGGASVEAMYKHKVECGHGVKTEIEEIIYKGEILDDAVNAIAHQGDFKEENSYEKIRIVYLLDTVEITLDVYPYGVWVEIEGDDHSIWRVAHTLGYRKEDAVTLNADELYLEWNKEIKLKEFWDVRFGFTGER